MRPILFNDQQDFSDEGLAVKKIEDDIDYQLLLKRLSERQLRALELKEDGYSLSEISRKLKISRPTLWREMKQIRELYGRIK